MATAQIKKDPAPDHLKSLVGRMAAEYGVDRDKFYATLANSIFAQGAKDRDGKFQPKVPTPEEMLALLVVCDKFKLDPFTRQIFAFSSKRGKIVPIVSIDGWLSIINRPPDYDGLEVVESQNLVQIGEVKIPEFCTVKI
ncbi:recombinase RecT, partial [Sutterella massiliensis]